MNINNQRYAVRYYDNLGKDTAAMISKLRRKFIFITAAALFTIILLVIAAINGIFIYQSNRHLNVRLDRIMNGSMEKNPPALKDTHDYQDRNIFSESGKQQHTETPSDRNIPQDAGASSDRSNPRNTEISAGFFKPFDIDLLIRVDGCLIFLAEDGSILELRQDSPEHYSEEELRTFADELYRQGKEGGWRQYFKYRMERVVLLDQTPAIKIGLVNASSDLYSVFTMLLTSISIGIISFLLVLLIIIIASGKAIKPIAESYTKQKQFVTDAGHELKTPLTVISANNELSRMLYGDSEWFDSIDCQVTKMNRLIRSLITLARMDEEEKPVFTLFSLSDAVYDTAKSFEKLIHAGGKLITFDIEEQVTFLGDEQKLRQLISILMDNAVKYCDDQGKIAVKLIRDKQIRLQIINDYSSVAYCDLDRVFERFYRADKARTSDGSYGLGLSIAKAITELHKGEIHAKTLEHNRLMFEVILNRPAKKQD